MVVAAVVVVAVCLFAVISHYKNCTYIHIIITSKDDNIFTGNTNYIKTSL